MEHGNILLFSGFSVQVLGRFLRGRQALMIQQFVRCIWISSTFSGQVLNGELEAEACIFNALVSDCTASIGCFVFEDLNFLTFL